MAIIASSTYDTLGQRKNAITCLRKDDTSTRSLASCIANTYRRWMFAFTGRLCQTIRLDHAIQCRCMVCHDTCASAAWEEQAQNQWKYQNRWNTMYIHIHTKSIRNGNSNSNSKSKSNSNSSCNSSSKISSNINSSSTSKSNSNSSSNSNRKSNSTSNSDSNSNSNTTQYGLMSLIRPYAYPKVWPYNALQGLSRPFHI